MKLNVVIRNAVPVRFISLLTRRKFVVIRNAVPVRFISPLMRCKFMVIRNVVLVRLNRAAMPPHNKEVIVSKNDF
ncbi:MAG: hypothetical protein LBH43_12475 [Treponema sp.]|nr:hypothetical protein [Treponema sp.]